MSVNSVNHSLIYKSVHRFKGAGDYREMSSGHLMQAEHEKYDYSNGVRADKSKFLWNNAHTDKTNLNDSVNKNVNTTAENNFSGRLSFKASATSKAPEIGGKFLQNLAKNKMVIKFVELAEKNMLLFEAAFALLITCGLRPATIMSLPTANKADKEKNKKAAAHSIASGIIGYGFALLVTTPIAAALTKINKNPAKYLNKANREFLATLDKAATDKKIAENLQKGIKGVSEKQAVAANAMKTVFTKGSEILLIPLRAAATVALIPVADKLILNKLIRKPKEENKVSTQLPYYTNSAIYFKGTESASQAFKNFREGQVQ